MTLSNGAQHIVNILKNNNIPFQLEYSYPDLKSLHHQLLRFDIAAMIPNIGLVLIEYDSEIHFKRINFFHKNSDDYKKACERDRIKNKYCLLNSILLYRIPYWEIDNINTIDDILQDKFLVKNKYHNDILNNMLKAP